jgi:hypothetical protein
VAEENELMIYTHIIPTSTDYPLHAVFNFIFILFVEVSFLVHPYLPLNFSLYIINLSLSIMPFYILQRAGDDKPMTNFSRDNTCIGTPWIY